MIAASVPTRSSRRVIIGVAMSMVAHVALLYAWRPAPQPAIAPPPVPAAIVLRLQPPAPVAPPAPAPVTAAAPAPQSTRRNRPAAEPRAPRRVIAVAPKASSAVEPEVVVEAQPVEAPAPKKFDLDAARSTARIVGLQDAPNADDAPLARLKKQQQANEIRTESKAAQAISAAKRGDCKDGLPGGLLAPLIMLTQKAGTGCKW